MPNDLTQIVTEKMQVLPIEEQQKVVEFVDLLSKPKRQTLLEKLAVISSRVPDEIWETLPTDGAENVDHYLYGSPKRK
jgi:hypothetical protein